MFYLKDRTRQMGTPPHKATLQNLPLRLSLPLPLEIRFDINHNIYSPMKTTLRRREMLLKSLTIAALPVATRALAAEDAPNPGAEQALFGPWFVTAGEVSIIISVEPSGQALVVFDEKGAITIGRHSWRPLANGILVDTLPRFRMWHLSDPGDSCEVRVQMENLPDSVEVSSGIRNFPRRFCMKRVDHAPLPRAVADRPLPKGWEAKKPAE